jgi:hypothetical protein
MYRIVYYLDDPPKRCAFLRETAFDYEPQPHAPFVVCAREYDDTGKCTRTWFLAMHSPTSDGVAARHTGEPPPLHKIVSPDLIAGEESKPADAMARICGGLEPVLTILKQNQIRDFIKVGQHETFCQTYNDALRRANEMETNLSMADANVRDLSARNATLASELQQSRAELAALRHEKSLTNRIRERVRVWFHK